jgi:hypothetical protein
VARRKHVAIAEKLAAENGGCIPSNKWLDANGYKATYDFLRQHPDAFAHLKRSPHAIRPVRIKPVRIKTIDARCVKREEAEQALAMYKSGLKPAQIAETLGIKSMCRMERVRRLLKAVGVDLPRQRMLNAQWNSEQREQIVALYESGSTIPAITAQFGYAHRIRPLLNAAGVYQPHRDKIRKPTSTNQTKPIKNRAFQEQVLAYYKDGMAIIDVAVHFGYRRGCGCNRVRSVLVRAGLYQLKQKPRQGGAAVVESLVGSVSSGAPAHHLAS